MSRGEKHKQSSNPAEIWREFVQAELKSKSKLSQLLENCSFGGYEDRALSLYFAEEQTKKAAQGQSGKIKAKLLSYRLPCEHIEFKTGEVPTGSLAQPSKQFPRTKNSTRRVENPLQSLCLDDPEVHLASSSYSLLAAVAQDETTCQSIYEKLKQRTQALVKPDGIVFSVSFTWRLRVGGTRGFLDLLLPVFHPIFGIPYVPASSLKGAARAWAEQSNAPQMKRLLGMLEGKTALAAKVEFLDAFPTSPCLSVDVATPQWHWQANQVHYKPEPHPLLSMEKPNLLIGLRPTSTGTTADVEIVKDWLENALKCGIGSRVSSGYGRALGQVASPSKVQSHNFELWTQGMYGSNPPTKQNGYNGTHEFRPTAIRGILRYWFRAITLSLYGPEDCQSLEDMVFGQLGKQGQLSVNVVFNPSSKRNPYLYTGTIILQASNSKVLTLANQLLNLASSLGGLGRGSRRPLHLLNGRMRGCHWSVESVDMLMPYQLDKWQTLFAQLKNSFSQIQSSVNNFTVDPGEPKKRRQDVLDTNAQVWLVESPNQIHPEQVKDWNMEGDKPDIRGRALTLLYSDVRFKGGARKDDPKTGNVCVGGALETPSFVWIKSVFPPKDTPYQVVTIFGVNNNQRALFAGELQKLSNQGSAKLVFGSTHNQQSVSPQRPKPKRK